MRAYTKKIKRTAWMLLAIMSTELIYPNVGLALTSGPSQPEVQSFEPVGTSDMVDMFSGDFVYNIPLLDVEGYPVNIAYHGGVTMEQEASWVGLGWNINPGEINRTVRGIPDDFDGEVLGKEYNIKENIVDKYGIGVGKEFVGNGDPKPNISITPEIGFAITFDNYKGVSCDLGISANLRYKKTYSFGLNIGVGSSSGADIDYSFNYTMPLAEKANQTELGFDFGFSNGFNSRSGVKNVNFDIGITANKVSEKQKEYKAKDGTTQTAKSKYSNRIGKSYHTSIPIGLQNYVPIQTNSSIARSFYARVKLGPEAKWNYLYVRGNMARTIQEVNNDGTRDAYGYLYLQDGLKDHPGCDFIQDFSRDKDGNFNKTMRYLPSSSASYDIYNVSGQGTGGVFRPVRNDYGSFFDSRVESDNESNSFATEFGIFDLFSIGADYNNTTTKIATQPWDNYKKKFTKSDTGSIYENVYFKEGGELTSVDEDWFNQVNKLRPVSVDQYNGLGPKKIHSTERRTPRANVVYFKTAAEMQMSGIGVTTPLYNYTSINGFQDGPNAAKESVPRISTGLLGKKENSISEITQIKKDGKKYIYGIPATNNVQKEVTFSVSTPMDDASIRPTPSNGLVSYSSSDDSRSNNKGVDNYYSAVVTPSYTHSYLLTSILSEDYLDVTGNGISDDDLGSYTKFNYSLKEKDFRWRAPYQNGQAQHSFGFVSDDRDDKAMYSIGSREQWYLHSIETKNYVAEFFTSPRFDACGSTSAIITDGVYSGEGPYNSSLSGPSKSYKLDSIKLYNKHERFIHRNIAVPIKTIIFSYDYMLCKGIPNKTTTADSGKLTLKRIYTKYGNSQISMMSPYSFQYDYNPNYDYASKDRWGYYKPNSSETPFNCEYPYVNQKDENLDNYASAWSLTKIQLPSGGQIEASYEMDDYAYVQDKQACEMFKVVGIGNTESYNTGNRLYNGKRSVNQYIYFERNIGKEVTGTIKDYVPDGGMLYYNFYINTRPTYKYEYVKGFAKIIDTGFCTDGIHGFFKVDEVDPEGGTECRVHPATYTLINMGRYYSPAMVYKYSAPTANVAEAIGHMLANFAELTTLFRNPIVKMVNRDIGKSILLSKSWVRLKSPTMKKKGGGQRVKKLVFSDSWNSIAGYNESSATYGKEYKYSENGVSTGVASYEPILGGDENPFRMPAPYIAAEGRRWPPMDPIGLYQELPMGESYFPAAGVGYSKVFVTSIHKDEGRSSKLLDIYEFYTAKDFPISSEITPISPTSNDVNLFFYRSSYYAASQSFAFVMNDMHGKMKSVSNGYYDNTGEFKSKAREEYIYNLDADGKLNNMVDCFVYNRTLNRYEVQPKIVGVDVDLSMDTREKTEESIESNFNVNLNVSQIAFFPIPIPLMFPWISTSKTQFRSATCTKIVQQYGILKQVKSFKDGANYTQTNEVFDGETGEILLTSLTDEYREKEYDIKVPAYWSYLGLGPSYQNINYKGIIPAAKTDSNRILRFLNPDPNLIVGDQLYLNYSGTFTTIAWYMGEVYVPPHYVINIEVAGPDSSKFPPIIWGTSTDPYPDTFFTYIPGHCEGMILPRFPKNTELWDTNVGYSNVFFQVISSGAKNLLQSNTEVYKTSTRPIESDGSIMYYMNNNVINSNAISYSDSNTVSDYNYLLNADTINPYSIGQRGIYRPQSQYSMLTDRMYTGFTGGRGEGLYSLLRLFFYPAYPDHCNAFPYSRYSMYQGDWVESTTQTKWSPSGIQIEERNALGIYSTALLGYNEDIPIAVANNARQGDILFDGFEDYQVLHTKQSIINHKPSFIKTEFNNVDAVYLNPIYDIMNLANPSGLLISNNFAHSGYNSLLISYSTPPSSADNYRFSIPIYLDNRYDGLTSRYNTYNRESGRGFGRNNEYLPFVVSKGKKYILSCWMKRANVPTSEVVTTYDIPETSGVQFGSLYKFKKQSEIIEGWQQYEVTFDVPEADYECYLHLPVGYYIDDIRIFPVESNMKSFVYNPQNQKLMATLDENNFGKFYEYDQEGKLVRVKVETANGIMTVSESRMSNHK